MTRLEEFAQGLYQEVLAKTGNETDLRMREDSFTELVLELLNEHNESDGAELCHHFRSSRGRIPSAKVNAWALSGDGATLDLFVTQYHGNGQPDPVSRTEVAEHFKLLRTFLKLAREGFHSKLEESAPVFQPAKLI